MEHFKEQMKAFYVRDLNQLADEIQEVQDDLLWETYPGITNSCGVLAQHMTGNLNHYIGTGMGDTGYERDREREFTNTGISKAELIESINETSVVIEETLDKMKAEQLDEPFPLYSSQEFTVGQMLIHLHGHFNYHLGQVNYLRRGLGENRG
ncbi:MAG TPA: DUF1572 family protein [Balneolaceae bacterium]|nr:DUF1572 family protein [Balneolaceae bacterium]